jgi:uncharacterized protein (TIGR01777 family)
MRVLMTGATGLIGKEIGKILAAAGHELTVVSRSPERARRQLPFPAKIIRWGGDQEPFPEEALQGQEGIIHLAGESVAGGRWTEARKQRIRDSRIRGTQRLVEAVIASRKASTATAAGAELQNAPVQLKAFICGSAIGFYGNRADEILTETSAAGEGFLAQVVIDWENEARALETDPLTSDVRVCYLRTGIVLSRQEGALAKMLPLFTAGVGGQLGDGQQWMSWIHITDIANLFIHCLLNASARGAVNGTAPEPARNDRFTLELARSLGRSVSLPVPKAALNLGLGEFASAVLDSERVRPEKALALQFKFEYPELTSALRELCEPLKDGQHEMIAEQWVPKKPSEIFPYFCSEKNLEALTPEFLKFRVLKKSTDEIDQGTLIDYKMRVHGFPVKWQTRIEDWNPGHSFVDVQLNGPYKKWHHTHEFREFAGGTLMRDRVLYQLPMGWFGNLMAGWKVTRDVQAIFAYRREKIDQLWRDE